ncbi:cation channel family protein (macronuclear) [Tetrahymena thermophila SB210]|uniref:Cation channel family protein n=1 Tax=Tetrahymena thermophila (strain SB210) TaxID=312017 RepID=Q22KJ7_TETTS|nr:cation channel family protein [Tetrahymena thermophila SB210]EAR85802.2 cation channel family protein [Tetrahymena thermophila SB210]|eukprot:XP_001033465.2 cation channel family protein [Tetrahymena thermophila SB210]
MFTKENFSVYDINKTVQSNPNLENGSIPTKLDLKTALQSIKLKQKIGNVVDKTAARRYQKLKKENFRMLNDLSIVVPEQQYSKNQTDFFIDQKEASFLEKLNKLFPPFNPSSRIKLIWDISQMILSICIIFIVPIHLVFQIDLMQLVPSVIVYTIIPVSLIIEIFVNLNTSCFLKGVLITNRPIILKNYLLQDFKYDLVSNIPLFIYCLIYVKTDQSEDYQFYRFIILSIFYKVLQFDKVFKRIEDEFPLSTTTSNVISLIKLLFSIILNLHISALAWLIMGFIQIKQGCQNTWMDGASISSADWYVQYIYSYYFSTVTMITVGYGDISPRTVAEKVLCIVNMMIACGQFAYSVNSIGNIFEQFFRLDNEIKANMKIINNYMTNKTISKDLQYQVREYLEYYWKQEKANNSELENKILEQLSHKLKDTLLMEANKIALRESPIFSTTFSESVLQKILPLIKEIRCTPEEIIYLKGDQDDLSIYFIEKGQVEAFTYQKTPFNKKMKTVNSLFTLSTGKFFGEYSFFTGEPRDINFRSLEFTTLLVIKRGDFINLLKDYPDDYEVFCMLKDEATYNNEKSSIMNKCQCCDRYDHSLSLCPVIHFVPQKLSVIRQFSTGRDQKRQTKKRNRNKKCQHAIYNNYDLQVRIEDFVNDYLDEIKAYFRKYFIEMGRFDSNESIPSSDINFEGYEDEDDEDFEDDMQNLESIDKKHKCTEEEVQKFLQINQNENKSETNSQITKTGTQQQKISINNIQRFSLLESQKVSQPLTNNQNLGNNQSFQMILSSLEYDKCEENVQNTNTQISNDKINQLQVQIKKPACSMIMEGQENESCINLKAEEGQNIQESQEQNIINLNRKAGTRKKTRQTTLNSQKLQKLQYQKQGTVNQQLNNKKQNIQSCSLTHLQQILDFINNLNIDLDTALIEMQKHNILTTNILNNHKQNRNSTQFTNPKPIFQQQGENFMNYQKNTQYSKPSENGHHSFLSLAINYESIDDIMRNYKLYYPQHNISNIIDNVIEKRRQKREDERKKMETHLQQQLNQSAMITKRVRQTQQKVLIANRSSKFAASRQSQITNFQKLVTKNLNAASQFQDDDDSSSKSSEEQSQVFLDKQKTIKSSRKSKKSFKNLDCDSQNNKQLNNQQQEDLDQSKANSDDQQQEKQNIKSQTSLKKIENIVEDEVEKEDPIHKIQMQLLFNDVDSLSASKFSKYNTLQMEDCQDKSNNHNNSQSPFAVMYKNVEANYEAQSINELEYNKICKYNSFVKD